MDWTWYLFRFDGRINRAKLWLAMVVLLGLMMSVGRGDRCDPQPVRRPRIVPFRRQGSLQAGGSRRLPVPDVSRPPRLLIKLFGISLLLWVYFATSIKRLHDRDKSGWWMVPFFVVPGLYNHFADRLPDSYSDPAVPCRVRSLPVGFLEMYCLKGSRKTNRFGADPLAPPPPRDTRPPWDQQSEIEMVPHKAGPPPVWRVKPGYE